MERTQIYLESYQKEKLFELSKKSGRKMSDLVREAVENYIIEQSIVDNSKALEKISGIWSDREDIADSEKYVRKLREGWKRNDIKK